MKYKIKLKGSELKALIATLDLARMAIENNLMPLNQEDGKELLNQEEAEEVLDVVVGAVRPTVNKFLKDNGKIKINKVNIIHVEETGELRAADGEKIPPEVLEALRTVIESEKNEQAETSPEPKSSSNDIPQDS